ncbi:hypothetical protein HN51_009664 [Arachis hypogaea]|uniref:SHSP domain-containing protein n=1 Tax=Arachis hypogaea TaxID=3818 RepID=A0A445CYN1_ARAHY|nr:16.9 kDa class I heat shock protein 2 [Arachis hypogaea]QHO44185.1 17.6 kDa class I heat shock protein [Arachis hypogaea]RYR55964.1 hypothetical protein Ahy_A05g021784 [Arachis hypogaea]
MDWIGSYRGLGGQRGGDEWRDPFYASPFTGLWDPSNNYYGGGDQTSALSHAHVDWRETDNAHIFRADLPGVRKEDLKVQVEDGNVLQISGERVKESEDTNDKWHRVECRRGSFTRRFRLPENANLDNVDCTLRDGVLTVNVPKKVESESQQNKNVRQIHVA